MTEFGIFIEVTLLQFSKQLSSKIFTEFEMVIDFKPVQPLKHIRPILVTEFGIVMEVKLLQSQKQNCPKLVTKLGMVIDFKL